MAKPIVKWVGGKTQLLPEILSLIGDRPQYDRYCAPFVGGGAVFWSLANKRPMRGILADTCEPLIRMYREVQLDPYAVVQELARLVEQYEEDGEGAYYEVRTLWNTGELREQTPARFIFLKQSSFNGLWRENRAGGMNAPWGKYARIKVPSVPELVEASVALQGMGLYAQDFRSVLEKVGQDQADMRWLIYLDPPYWGTFNQYGQRGWQDARDQASLIHACASLCACGHRVIYSNADCPEINQLLDEHWPEGVREHVTARRSVNSKGSGRGPVGELLVHGGGL